MGSLIGGIFLLIGGLLIYKRYQYKRENKNTIPTPGNEQFHEVLANPTRGNINDIRHEIISMTPSTNSGYYYGQKMLPIVPVANNENSTNNEVINFYNYATSSAGHQIPSLRNINDRANFKNEILQTIRQEVMQNPRQHIAQNNEQVSNTNDLEKFKNEIIQAVRQEIMQNPRRDVTQNNEQISNTNVLENFKNEILQAVRQEIVQNLREDSAHEPVSNTNINK